MNSDAILLRECNSGCKSATNSMEQVLNFVEDNELKKVITKYNDKHIKIGDEIHQLLNDMGHDEKDPHPVAKTAAWISTEIKLMANDDAGKIAELMIDGCNMGIKYVSKFINKNDNASQKIKDIAKNLISCEQEFMQELYKFL